jgi:DNA-directed RNA polymerase subunit RPC12/RpoP
MSHLVSRIMLAIFMLPLAAVTYVLSIIVGENMTRGGNFNNFMAREAVEGAVAGVITWAFVSLYWFLLWRKSVMWTGKRRLLTCLAAGGLLAGMLFFLFLALATSDSTAMGFHMFGTILAPLLWLIATVFIWRETPAERGRRVRSTGNAGVACPTCGYNLTGLSESRCPECGSRFTLDELMAAQPAVVVGGEME